MNTSRLSSTLTGASSLMIRAPLGRVVISVMGRVEGGLAGRGGWKEGRGSVRGVRTRGILEGNQDRKSGARSLQLLLEGGATPVVLSAPSGIPVCVCECV